MSGLIDYKPAMPDSLRIPLEATKVEYRRLGKSGLKVSVPILGAMSFGNSKWLDWVLEEDKVCSVHHPSRQSSMKIHIPLLAFQVTEEVTRLCPS